LKDVTADFVLGLKLVLVWCAEYQSPSTLGNNFSSLKHFLSTVSDGQQLSEITDVHILNYRATLTRQKEYQLGRLRGFFKRWYKLSGIGITDNAIAVLNELKLSGNIKGTAVATHHLTEGPFTHLERSALSSTLERGYTTGKVTTEDFLLCIIVMFFGLRPAQVVMLKVCDVKLIEKTDGSLEYLLRIPSAKKRTRARTKFAERIFKDPEIGRLLWNYVQDVKNDFGSLVDDVEQLPLFPERQKKTLTSGLFAFHMENSRVTERLQKIFQPLNVRSERTGDPIHIAATRFRRTVGTVAANEGWGELVIAELLDHTDTQNAGIYVEATPAIIKRIDKKLALHLAPIAQAFAGKLVDGRNTPDGGDKQQIIAPQYTQDFAVVGTCGQHSFCSFSVPLGCYTCVLFNAWLDGPHEQILEKLIAERERLGELGNRIASVHDLTIKAVAEVVAMCKQQNDEMGALDG
jgi:integrase